MLKLFVLAVVCGTVAHAQLDWLAMLQNLNIGITNINQKTSSNTENKSVHEQLNHIKTPVFGAVILSNGKREQQSSEERAKRFLFNWTKVKTETNVNVVNELICKQQNIIENPIFGPLITSNC